MAHERIDINPKIMAGKPVIRGTRIPVELILRKLGGREGLSRTNIIGPEVRVVGEDLL